MAEHMTTLPDAARRKIEGIQRSAEDSRVLCASRRKEIDDVRTLWFTAQSRLAADPNDAAAAVLGAEFEDRIAQLQRELDVIAARERNDAQVGAQIAEWL